VIDIDDVSQFARCHSVSDKDILVADTADEDLVSDDEVSQVSRQEVLADIGSKSAETECGDSGRIGGSLLSEHSTTSLQQSLTDELQSTSDSCQHEHKSDPACDNDMPQSLLVDNSHTTDAAQSTVNSDATAATKRYLGDN